MVESKNLKLKLGLCGLALTSFLALNTRSNTVHADTMSGSNANAITWDSDQDDSQVVHEDSQQSQSLQSVQTQGAVQGQEVPANQFVQSNNQKHVKTSALRVSNFDTSAVNRLNANSVRNNANVKVATVHDTSQMPVQKTKVAQFNQGSKIYTLNGSNQLSKNNGDGYVITNAGTYNGRAVDIGVTINNVQNNQGSYTTKWSNGDKADVTGKVDNDFNYQNSVLIGSKSITPQVDQSQTRTYVENQTKVIKTPGYVYQVFWRVHYGDGSPHNYDVHEFVNPQLMYEIKQKYNLDDKGALQKIYADCDANIHEVDVEDVNADGSIKADAMYKIQAGWEDNDGKPKIGDFDRAVMQLSNDTKDSMGHIDESDIDGIQDIYVIRCTVHKDKMPTHDGVKAFCPIGVSNSDGDLIKVVDHVDSHYSSGYANRGADPNNPAMSYGYDFYHNSVSDMSKEELECTKPLLSDYTWTETKPVQVTDHLQLDHMNNGGINYNYTVGLYDAQTGELITDLKPEYKSKAGVAATTASSVMNNAIKNKIQQINQGKATVSYTGTSANDDVAFYQETRQVNPQDKNVNRQVQRVIHINFPNGVKPASYDSITDSAGNKLTLDSNNNLTQSMSFTRTGVQNIVSGQVTYGNWQQHGAINAVTLPSIPGYTMVTNN